LHLVGILFPHINYDARSKSHQKKLPFEDYPEQRRHHQLTKSQKYLNWRSIESMAAVMTKTHCQGKVLTLKKICFKKLEKFWLTAVTCTNVLWQ